jgi:hypothetical protein
VIYLGIDGPDSLNQGNNYAVRVKNAGELLPQGGGVRPKGLTVVTSQPIYVIGDYNAVNKIPAAIFSDRFNALSNNWADVNPAAPESSPRTASDTTYNMALISGVPKTGGANGPAGISNGAKNGGLQNFLLKHEKWAGKLQTYRGAFVSFGEPQKNNGIVDFRFDSAPNRNYGFDKDFFDSDKLPPMTPVFTYNRQELFVRSFTQE